MAGYGNTPVYQLVDPIPRELFPIFLAVVAVFCVVLVVHRRSIRYVLPWQAVVWLAWDDVLVAMRIRKPMR